MNKEMKFNLTKIIVALVFFITALLLDEIQIEALPFSLNKIIFVAAYLIVGYSTLIKAVVNIFAKNFLDENFLMSLASIGAIALGQFGEAVAVMIFYTVGEFFEDYASNKSRKSISDLMEIKPDIARLLLNGVESEVDPSEIEVGSIVIVRPGEKIPIDGVVLDGFSNLNTAALTGESLPKDVAPGDTVVSGCINNSGLLKIKTTTSFDESTVSKILELIENAGNKKARVEKFITKFSKYYTPSVVIAAIFLAIVPPLVAGQPFDVWVYRALLFLVVSCPCALVLSVPLSFFGGVGAASKQGILVKGSSYLEALTHLKTVIFDKTGTLTSGDFSVVSVNPVDCTAAELLTTAAYVEYHSNHPIASAIKREYIHSLAEEGVVKEFNIDDSLIQNYEEVAGKGATAKINGNFVCAGNAKLMELLNIHDLPTNVEGTVIHIASGNKYIGYISVEDTIKEDTKLGIDNLRNLGIVDTVMLTGDKKSIAQKVAAFVGISKVYSELLPDNKVEITKSIIEDQEKNSLTAFVGDGINDAPVLATVDIGIAMGSLGSQAAIEAADIVIMDDNIDKISTVIKIARKTQRIAKQNIGFALFIKALVLVLGTIGIANMWMAIFADVGVSILAILNAFRTLFVQSNK